MKRSFKTMLGATLLEVMLVLAIAAMIIVMSIRYYQTAQQNQQANAFVSQIQAIIATSNSLQTATGSYSGVNTSVVTSMLPSGGMKTPWATDITVTGGTSSVTITIGGTTPTQICSLSLAKIKADKRVATTSTCNSIVYNAGF